jgi:putative transposase
MRDELLVVGQTYHIFSRSIAGFKIFNSENEYARIVEVFAYYKQGRPIIPYSQFVKLSDDAQGNILKKNSTHQCIVDIIAYCVMPTHIHLILKQLTNDGISVYLKNILNSYTRYFNTKHKRKGPLWEGRFKSVLVSDDEYLLHLSRYVHLNPTTSHLVDRPEDWKYSSLCEYLSDSSKDGGICKFNEVLEIVPADYKSFVEDRIAYQRELHIIGRHLLEE